jgi:flagella basal body P-ring formation protein FlgA
MIPLDLPPTEALQASLIAYVEEQCSAEEVEVGWIGLDPKLLPEGELIWQGNPCRSRPNLFLSVIENQMVQSRMTLRPSLTIWVEVPVAATDTPMGKQVQPVPGRAKLSELFGDPIHDAWEARVFIPKGAPITTAVVKPIPDARNGAAIKLIVRIRTLIISAEGRLLEDGFIGDDVRVRNHATGNVMTGVLRDPGTVVLRSVRGGSP